ncbi:hypothetical protein LTT66_32205 [Nocardia gipuzkoensis]|uniref:hypothetical protein n=1 Tax=Nocardia gipuzkoensis TaxID=2749991 RepID=UPI001E3EB053|nr:hypothetical protein [Nocardia gipuzkoensis]UGT67799.1 hypothetical protein LTT66_32205 [Nocardia gipuzkoensis]
MVSTAIVAAGWAIWHVPLFAVVESFREFIAVTVIGWLLGLFCSAIFSTWLYNRTGGSVAVVAVWRACYNMVSAPRAAEGVMAAAVTTMEMVTAAALLITEVRRTAKGSPSVLGAA